MQATALSTSPVLGSHSGMTAVTNVPRNMDDEMLAAIKKNSGVIQIVAVAELCEAAARARFGGPCAARRILPRAGGRPGRRWSRRWRGGRASLPPDKQAEYDRKMAAIEAKWPLANVADFVNHIDHAVKCRGHRSRRHQLRLRWRRRHHRLERRESDVQRDTRARAARLQRRGYSKVVGRERAARHGREPEAREAEGVVTALFLPLRPPSFRRPFG